MKRSLAIFLVLLLPALGAVTLLSPVVNNSVDDVRFSETAQFGDKSVTEGLEVELHVRHIIRLYWDTRYQPYPDDAQTDFRFYATGYDEPGQIVHRGVSCSGSFFWPDAQMQEGNPEDIPPLSRAVMDFQNSVPSGQEKTRNFYLSDYMDYYELAGCIDLPGLTVFWGAEEVYCYRNSPNSASQLTLQVTQAFEDYFKLPVLEGQGYEVTISKIGSGNIMSTSGSSTIGEDAYFPYAESVVAGDACYFYFTNRSAEDRIMDFSQVPGGYGIYCLPYGVNAEGQTEIDLEGLSTVYSLDPEVRITDMALSSDGKRLLLTTEEAGGVYLTVLRLSDMAVLQHLQFTGSSPRDETHYWICHGEDFLVCVSLEGASDHFIVLQEQADGTYRHCFNAHIPPDRENGPGASLVHLDFYPSHIAFDGQRLAIVDVLEEKADHHFGKETCGFWVAVYTAEGLAYYGEYTSSLEQSSTEFSDSYSPSPDYRDALNLRWK